MASQDMLQEIAHELELTTEETQDAIRILQFMYDSISKRKKKDTEPYSPGVKGLTFSLEDLSNGLKMDSKLVREYLKKMTRVPHTHYFENNTYGPSQMGLNVGKIFAGRREKEI